MDADILARSVHGCRPLLSTAVLWAGANTSCLPHGHTWNRASAESTMPGLGYVYTTPTITTSGTHLRSHKSMAHWKVTMEARE